MRVLVNYEGRYEALFPKVRDMLRKYGASQVVCSTSTLSQIRISTLIQHLHIDRVVICNPSTKAQLLLDIKRIPSIHTKVSDEQWAGSIIDLVSTPTMFAIDFRTWYAKPQVSFILETHIKKLLSHTTEELLDRRKYDFTYVTDDNAVICLTALQSARLIAVDIETAHHHRITMVGYCAVLDDGSVKTYVVDVQGSGHGTITPIKYQFIKDANLTKAPKVFHNGTYDNTMFAYYNLPVYNYILDTEYMFYSLYAELPRTLAFVTAFYLPTAEYWKDTAGKDLGKYNALDCYNTLHACMAILSTPEYQSDGYGLANYKKVFPLTTPCIWSGIHGMLVDKAALLKSREEAEAERIGIQEDLDKMCGLTIRVSTPEGLVSDLQRRPGLSINVNSPKMMPALFYRVLRSRKVRVRGKIGGCDETTLNQLAEQCPLTRRFAECVTAIRKRRKAINTYYDAHLFHGRLIWGYRIDGTETGRLSCKQSSLGPDNKSSYGAQVQNIPRYMKHALTADDGFILFEKDYSQSEARCVAYIADDKALIKAFEDSDAEDGGDFYNTCGTLFFGIPAKDVPHVLRNKVIKRIIHGSNYMMGGKTFVDAAGKTNLVNGMLTLHNAGAVGGTKARPVPILSMSIGHFANYLLSLYHRSYPNVSQWYKTVKLLLCTGGICVSERGWTRRFFGDPYADKTLREAVAHQPQNLSVDCINDSVIRVFWEVQVPSKGEYKFIAQIHDSILSQCKLGTEDKYQALVEEIMHQPVTFKKTGETLVIPIDGNSGHTWKECH